jgi:hypothetical protein
MKSCKSVHESAALAIGRRGLGHHERLPKELMDAIKTKVKRQLIAVLGSMEESCKQSKSGKKQRQSIAIVLRKMENVKHEHEWSLWNMLHKFCWLNQYQIQLREVYTWLLKSLSCTDRWKEWCTTGAVADSEPRDVFHNRWMARGFAS